MALKTDPAEGAFAITPNDSVDLTRQTTGIYVGGAGNISLITSRGETVLFTAVQVGILPVQATRVRSAGTTATALVGLYTVATGIPS